MWARWQGTKSARAPRTRLVVAEVLRDLEDDLDLLRREDAERLGLLLRHDEALVNGRELRLEARDSAIHLCNGVGKSCTRAQRMQLRGNHNCILPRGERRRAHPACIR